MSVALHVVESFVFLVSECFLTVPQASYNEIAPLT